MATLIKPSEIDLENTLFVFALDYEAGSEFEHCTTVFSGIGKIFASYAVTKAIQQYQPKLIVNLGSAGSHLFKRGEVVCCTHFIQRDMDVRGLGFKQYETPLSGIPPVLEYGLSIEHLPQGICGSGDSFEMEHKTDAYNVVDMEAYALALIAYKEEIPFLCLKYITDGADGGAADEWSVQVHNAALALKKVLF